MTKGHLKCLIVFKNYLLVAWRHLFKNKTFSIITILGLALGIASTLLIIFHVKQELSFDRSFTRSDRIYRITQKGLGDDTRHWAATSYLLGPEMQQQIPGIESSARLHRPYPYLVFSYSPATGDTKRFEESGGFFADPGITDMFDLEFIRGNGKTALTEKNGLVLTEEMAEKYFGKEDPLGKTLMDVMQKIPMKITGVVRALPTNSHLRFDYLLSMSTIVLYVDNASLERRTWNGFYNYVLLDGQLSNSAVDAKLAQFTQRYFAKSGDNPQQQPATRKLHLQPITSIHLHSKLEKEVYANSDITYVYIFSIAAFFILLIAAVNFINMATAQAFHRMKEIGMRKVVGASRPQLIRQFLGESLLSTFLATSLALILFRYALPFYNQITGTAFQFEQLFTFRNAGLLILLILAIGILSGAYPAWFVANFNPVSSLKAKRQAPGGRVNMVRKGLIVFQFVIAVFMIFSTIIVYRQLNLFHNKNLGFDKEQVIAVTMYPEMWKNYSAITDEVRANKSVASWSIVSTLPGERFSMQSFSPLSVTDEEARASTRVMYGDEKLLETLSIPVKQGRNFYNQVPEIRNNEFIINESAVSALNIKDPIGKAYVLDRDTGTIVGIVNDFNFASLHSPVESLVIQYNPYRATYMLIKIQPGNIKAALVLLQKSVKSLAPASVFSYRFIDEKLNDLYKTEARMSMVFKIFASLALLISCLGLFALSAFSAHLRLKELGIRKVLGASVSQVVFLLSGGFLKLVLLATLIALPVGYWIMDRWLDDFAYRAPIGADVFLLAGSVALIMGFLTVSLQALRVAMTNPVNSLKIE